MQITIGKLFIGYKVQDFMGFRYHTVLLGFGEKVGFSFSIIKPIKKTDKNT